MKAIIERFRVKGIRVVITAAVFIVLSWGIDIYSDILQDKTVANKLQERELLLAKKDIEWELHKVEEAIEELAKNTYKQLEHPDNMFDITLQTIEKSNFMKAVFIAFVPDYYPEKGRWFQPGCVRQDSILVKEQCGSAQHDYFQKDWYKTFVGDTQIPLKWSAPYTDHTQNDIVVMTLCSPLCDSSGQLVAVVGIDVSLLSLHHLLKSIEPYPGSICQLLDSKGNMIVSSGETEFDSEDYLIGITTVSQHHGPTANRLASQSSLQVRLAIPKSEVYGPSARQGIISLLAMIMGLLLLTLIVQRSFHNHIKLNEAQQQRQSMENEMKIAHDIQMNILRHDFPKSLYATLLPMKEVGGDLYDFYQKDDTLFFIIGDVSGKGIPAAMMMSGTVALFRSTARHFDTPVEIVSEINHVVSERNKRLVFVTAFVGKLDTRHGLLTYCNAGHNPPVINGELLKTDPDIPIGYDADYCYRQFGTLFGEGSQIVLYTDGITEARNAERKFMGTSRLLSVISEHHQESVSSLNNAIINATRQFTGNADARDDMTLMCLSNDAAVQMPTLVINNDIEELSRVKPLLREYCECMHCDRQTTRKIMLAVEEAVANAINYAYPKGELGSIKIDINAMPSVSESQKGDITVIITDTGVPFNPLARQTVDVEQATRDRQVGGLGIYLYREIMDFVSYRRTDEGTNELTLTKDINIIN